MEEIEYLNSNSNEELLYSREQVLECVQDMLSSGVVYDSVETVLKRLKRRGGDCGLAVHQEEMEAM
jgi:hypothetical protein